VPLQTFLEQNVAGPTIIPQPSFENANLRDTFLQSLELDARSITQMPVFGSIRPDVISVHNRLLFHCVSGHPL
jgi:hypothetical protein